MKETNPTGVSAPMDDPPARRLWQTYEPVHAFVYFVEEAPTAYARLGVEPVAQYFASRSAALGAASAGLVTATFYNFSPGLVGRAMRDVWTVTTPDAVIAARLAAVEAAWSRFTAGRDLDDAVEEASELAAKATAVLDPAGRPLFAGHAGLAEPDRPFPRLWHHLTLLREHRGDGHVVALISHGVDPLAALLTSEGYAKLPLASLRRFRGWRPEEWEAAAERLVERGWLEPDGSLTSTGRKVRNDVERLTDRLSAAPWDHLGQVATARFQDLMRPLRRAVLEGGGLPV